MNAITEKEELKAWRNSKHMHTKKWLFEVIFFHYDKGALERDVSHLAPLTYRQTEQMMEDVHVSFL